MLDKYFNLVLLAALILIFSNIYAQSYDFECRVLNQIVNGTELSFEVYILNTGTDEIYLGNCDFSFTFNYSNFTNPSTNFIKGGDFIFYGFSINILESSVGVPNIVDLNLNAPAVDETNFDLLTAQISRTYPGTKVSTITISGISNPGGTANLQWRSASPHPTIVSTFINNPPDYTIVNITSDGSYLNPADAPLPVQLTTFTATFTVENWVKLYWSTTSEINNYGFFIERRREDEQNFVPLPAAFIPGSGNSNQTLYYSYVDKTISEGEWWWFYRLKQMDYNGNYQYVGEVSIKGSETPPSASIVSEFDLKQNYPNPFNPSTTIEYYIPPDYTGEVELAVFDLQGKQIVTLVNGNSLPGLHKITWDGKGNNDTSLPSGIYYYRLSADNLQLIHKMMLLK